MLAAEILTSIAEVSVALLGFTGIIAAFRQPAVETWPPHIAYRFRFIADFARVFVGCTEYSRRAWQMTKHDYTDEYIDFIETAIKNIDQIR